MPVTCFEPLLIGPQRGCQIPGNAEGGKRGAVGGRVRVRGLLLHLSIAIAATRVH